MSIRKERIHPVRTAAHLSPLLLALLLVLAACGGGGAAGGTPPADPSAGQTPSNTEETAAPEDGANPSRILVVYYSHTGNTRQVAQRIAEQTGGDLSEIQRAQPYTDLQREAEAEIESGARPAITETVTDLTPYDVIFVGYPIWWDSAPAMIATFLESHDFSGKTLVPFCTSASDPIDNSLSLFAQACPEATLAPGLTANDLDDIEPWLAGLPI